MTSTLSKKRSLRFKYFQYLIYIFLLYDLGCNTYFSTYLSFSFPVLMILGGYVFLLGVCVVLCVFSCRLQIFFFFCNLYILLDFYESTLFFSFASFDILWKLSSFLLLIPVLHYIYILSTLVNYYLLFLYGLESSKTFLYASIAYIISNTCQKLRKFSSISL